MLKYRNIKTEVDGIVFDSKAEARRYAELRLLEKANEISDLRLQPEFDCMINGQKICTYKADFEYWIRDKEFSPDDKYIVEDVKGFKTQVYKLKKKLVEALHGVEIREVRA
jgi:hypothetical protein